MHFTLIPFQMDTERLRRGAPLAPVASVVPAGCLPPQLASEHRRSLLLYLASNALGMVLSFLLYCLLASLSLSLPPSGPSSFILMFLSLFCSVCMSCLCLFRTVSLSLDLCLCQLIAAPPSDLQRPRHGCLTSLAFVVFLLYNICCHEAPSKQYSQSAVF